MVDSLATPGGMVAPSGVFAYSRITPDSKVVLLDLADEYPDGIPSWEWYQRTATARNGRCYELAYQALTAIEDADLTVQLVHGWQRCHDTTGRGRDQMGHAWLEFTADSPNLDLASHVWEPISMTLVPHDEWYEQAGQVRTYTQYAAVQRALRSLHYGPWHARPFGIEGEGTE